MAFWSLANIQLEEFRPGVKSKAMIGEGLIMAVIEIGANKEDTGHEHPFEQCGLVLEGRIEMVVGEDRKLLTPNETYFIPAGCRHGWKTGDEPVRVLDISGKQ